ncbi:MAG: tRNA (guanosine(46)-N7)-methyltransferase TrmB [Roseburia hominis]
MRKKPNLGVRMERCTRVLISDPEEWKGKWRELMPEAKEVFLELGCGKGRFTAETAAQNPQALYIAVERVPDAMVIAMERVCAQELHNVFFVDGDVAQLPLFFAPGEVDRIYINFCDPWPSNRHAKRRLTHPDFLLRYRQVLAEAGRSTSRQTTGIYSSGPCSSSPGWALGCLGSPATCTPTASTV